MIKNIVKIDKKIIRFVVIDILLMLMSLLFTLITPLVYQRFIDDCLVNKDVSYLGIIIVAYFLMWFLDTFISFLRNEYEQKYLFKFKKFFAEKAMNNALRITTNISLGDLKDRIESDVYYLVIKNTIDKIYNYILITGCVIMMIYINYIFGLSSLLIFPLAIFLLKPIHNKMIKYASEYRETFGEYETWLVKTCDMWDDLKENGHKEFIMNKFYKRWVVLNRLYLKRQICFVAQYCLNEFKDTFLIKLNLYFLGIAFIMTGNMTVGMLLAFMKYYEKCINTYQEINTINANNTSYKPYLEKAEQLVTENISEPNHKPLV